MFKIKKNNCIYFYIFLNFTGKKSSICLYTVSQCAITFFLILLSVLWTRTVS